MRILILGGTGAMGAHLVKLLSSSGHILFITTRSQKQSIENLHYIQGNALEMEFLISLLKDQYWDAIVDFMVYDIPSFKDRVEILLKSTSQYIFVSSARVYADSKTPLTESSCRLVDVSQDQEYISTREYALTKARQEDILKSSGRNNWTIIRPYITYSEDRLQLGVLEKEDWLYRALKGRSIVFSSDIHSRLTTLTYGLDVSKGISCIIGNPDALGEIFHITSSEPIKWSQVLSIYLNVLEKHLGFRPKVLFVNLDQFVKVHPAKYQIIYDRFYNRVFDSTKIAQYTDPNTFLSVEDGLKNCLEVFLKREKFKTINWKSEAIRDKQSKEKTVLKEITGYKQKLIYLVYRYLI